MNAIDEEFAHFSSAVEAGRGAVGWLVAGDMHGSCDVFAARALDLLFPGCARQIRSGNHPDIFVLAPEGKSRTIKVESVREKIIEPLGKAAYSGGWRAAVIEGADRFQEAAANAFLKTLEEPPAKTLFLLLTDAPDAMLATIVSRCRRINLPRGEGVLDGAAFDEFEKIFSLPSCCGCMERAEAAAKLAALLDHLEERAQKEDREEDLPLVRKAFFRTAVRIARRWMESGALPLHKAVRNIEAVESACARVEAYIGKDAALAAMMDRISFP